MLLCVSLKVMLLCEASQTSHNFVMVAEPLSLEQQETIFIQGYFGTSSEANLSKIINIDKKRKGPRTEPCGTPEITGAGREYSPLPTTD